MNMQSPVISRQVHQRAGVGMRSRRISADLAERSRRRLAHLREIRRDTPRYAEMRMRYAQETSRLWRDRGEIAVDWHRGVVIGQRGRKRMIVISRSRAERAERYGRRGARVVTLLRGERAWAGGRLLCDCCVRDYCMIAM